MAVKCRWTLRLWMKINLRRNLSFLLDAWSGEITLIARRMIALTSKQIAVGEWRLLQLREVNDAAPADLTNGPTRVSVGFYCT